jgi:putative ABC transport system permease protein
MIFQGSLLAGFMRASSRIIDLSKADIWITARGTPCFDFAAPIPERFRDLSLGVVGVSDVRRMATSFALWQRPSGEGQTVVIIGADAESSSAFPHPRLEENKPALPDVVLVDHSNLKTLGVTTFPMEVEINRRKARVLREINGASSFMGSPYVFTSYSEAVKYLELANEQTTYLLVQVRPGAEPEVVKNELAKRLPEVDVWTSAEFARRAQLYWIAQTGAGGALLTAAFLGFIVGTVIVSQTIYATTMENIEEFATLKALGASRWAVQKMVLLQALASGAVGAVLGLALTFPAVSFTRTSIPWIYTPLWLPSCMIGISLLMCLLASIVSIRRAVSIDPGRVFRA